MLRIAYPHVRLVANAQNSGFSKANNICIKKSDGDCLLFLNPDTQVFENSLNELVRFLDQHPQAAACGPKLVYPNGRFQSPWANFPTLKSELALISRTARCVIGPYAPCPAVHENISTREVDWVTGAALCARREAVEQAGMFDEGFFFSSEETFLCWQMRKLGWKIFYVQEAVVMHVAGSSSSQRPIESYGYLYSGKLRFFEMAYGKTAQAKLRLALFIFASLRSLLWRILIKFPDFGLSKSELARRGQQENHLLKILRAVQTVKT